MTYKYLMFCMKCGFPTEISTHVLHHYLSNKDVEVIYCHHCYTENDIPHYLKKIANELQ